MLACSVWGVLAVAGLTEPHTFQFGTPGHRGCGGRLWSEVTRSGRRYRPWGVLFGSMGLNNPQWVPAMLGLELAASNGGALAVSLAGGALWCGAPGILGGGLKMVGLQCPH